MHLPCQCAWGYIIDMENPEITIFDRLLAKTVLRLIPQSVKPNHITVARLILTPAVVLLLWLDHYWIGLILFLLTAFTDAIDGALARTRDQITDWGKMFDPFADKLLICSTVFIIILKYVDIWAGWVIIFLEILIIIAALIQKKMGRVVQANLWGKIKMNLQVLGVVLLLISIVFQWEHLLPVSQGLLYTAAAFGILSLFSYGI